MTEPHAFNPHDFYNEQGQISEPGRYTALLDDLPVEIPELVESTQGLMLHLHWASRLGFTLNRLRREESNLRTIQDRLPKIIELEDAALRPQGVPIRVRCGFETYFVKGNFEDHWVGEYWHAEDGRWVMVDPQLDPFQIEQLEIDFNPLNLPRTKFLTGGQAWICCQSKRVEPKWFGTFRKRGLDFVKGDLIRDFLALNKVEILPWDNFLMINKSLIHMRP
jgi:hypothetical protein